MNAVYQDFASIAFGLMAVCIPEAVALQRATQALLQQDKPIKAIVEARAEVERKLNRWSRA